jgi:uncharacterized protein
MRNTRSYLAFVWLAITCLVGGVCSGTARADERQFWMGEILMPNTACPRLTYVVKLRRPDPAVAWTGTMSIPRGCGVGGIIDVPLMALSVSEERLSFVTPPPSENAYEAALAPGEKVATGQVMIGGTQAVAIRMWRVTEEVAKNAAPRRPQMPDEGFPYDVKEVRVPAPMVGATDGVLSGVLSTPRGAGPFPGVVLVTDAEPHDRDHSEGTHKPFVVLADKLTRAGYVVLRCDDRGIGESSGSCVDSTLEDAARDVVAQVKYLSQAAGVDASRIGVIGRGEGAHVGAMAAGASEIGFVVMLGAAGQKGIDVACVREERQLQAIGEDATYISERVGRLRKALELAISESKEQDLDAVLREDARAYVSEVRGMGLQMTKDQIAMWASTRAEVMLRPRFKSWLATDPTEAMKRLMCPVLALSGELDLVMPAADEMPLVKAALEVSGSKRVVTKVLARTNHALQPCATGFEDEVDLIETTISEEAVREIVGFLGAVTGK